MTLSEFVRAYPLRAKNIAFFFGAGTSVAAGMPSAWDLVWQFKRMIYCSEERYNLSFFKNLTDPAIRRQIQSYFNSKGDYPPEDSIEEYSLYFEKAFPYPADRRIFLTEQLDGMQNSYGHKALGILMKNALSSLIFTTNFDKAFENAAIDVLKRSDNFFVGSIDNAETSRKIYFENKRPFICKLHGDYYSEKLKNTSPELQNQDKELRNILLHSCISNGFAMMGYSGRDESIMAVFDEALDQPISFPGGIYWFVKSDSQPLSQVTTFISKALSKGIEAHIVEIETFDTAMADLIKGIPNLPTEDTDQLNKNYFVRPGSYLPNKGTNYPIIRFNAVTVSELPATARKVECSVGNEKAVKELIVSNNQSVIAIRKKEGVIGFGPDSEFEKIFSPYGITKREIYHISNSVIQYQESTLKGLLSTALLMSLTREKPLIWTKRRDRYMLFPSYKNSHLSNPIFDNLKRVLQKDIFGQIPGTGIRWLAAVEIELSKKMSDFFMLVTPTIITTKTDIELEKLQIAPFVKEATARWYNAKYDGILEVWLDILFQNETEITISAFNNDVKGVNAHYKLHRKSPFTKKI